MITKVYIIKVVRFLLITREPSKLAIFANLRIGPVIVSGNFFRWVVLNYFLAPVSIHLNTEPLDSKVIVTSFI